MCDVENKDWQIGVAPACRILIGVVKAPTEDLAMFLANARHPNLYLAVRQLPKGQFQCSGCDGHGVLKTGEAELRQCQGCKGTGAVGGGLDES